MAFGPLNSSAPSWMRRCAGCAGSFGDNSRGPLGFLLPSWSIRSRRNLTLSRRRRGPGSPGERRRFGVARGAFRGSHFRNIFASCDAGWTSCLRSCSRLLLWNRYIFWLFFNLGSRCHAFLFWLRCLFTRRLFHLIVFLTCRSSNESLFSFRFRFRFQIVPHTRNRGWRRHGGNALENRFINAASRRHCSRPVERTAQSFHLWLIRGTNNIASFPQTPKLLRAALVMGRSDALDGDKTSTDLGHRTV